MRDPGLYYGVPAAEYHAGLAENPRPLSSTLAKNLLRKLPAEAKWELENPTFSDAFDIGTAAHELILEGTLKSIVELDFDSWRSKAARDARDEARTVGLVPMLPNQLAGVRAMAEKVRSAPGIAELLSGGAAEVSALATMGGVPVQTRYDYLRLPSGDHGGYIIDLKTVAGSASPRDFERNGATYGYHIQAALYQQALETLGHPRLPFYWLVVSKQEPYAHSLIQASEIDLMTGLEMVDKALEKWVDITENGWPTNTPMVQSMLPTWTQYELEQDEIEV